jgi:membrane protease YdiL (CAAX protease family)
MQQFMASLGEGINWGLPLYLLALYGVVRYFIQPPKADTGGKLINWSPLESVGITLAIYFASQVIGSALIYIYPLSQHWSQSQTTKWFDSSVAAQFFLVLFVEGITVLLLRWFLHRRHSNLRPIGFKKPDRVGPSLAYIPLGFLVYFLSYVVILGVVQQIVHIDVGQKQQLGFSDAHGLGLVAVFVSLVILPPIVEELLVRGFLYSGLKNKLPKIWAVLLTSGLFALAHLQAGSGEKLLWVAAIDTFILSLVLIYLKEKTGSLWASIGLHMLKNCVAFLSLFVFHVI